MHGGSRQEWPVRFAFIVNFVMLEIMLASIESKPSILDDVQSKKFALPVVTAVAIFVLADIAVNKYAVTQITLLTVGSVVGLFWLSLYIVTVWHPPRWIIVVPVVIIELVIMQYAWFAPNFTGYSYSKHQGTDHWNTSEFNQYFFTSTDMAREINHSEINPLVRARDFDGVFGSNYAFITETNSIGAFYGGMSKNTKALYASLGHSHTGGQCIFDSGGTLFTDALLNIRSVFTLDKTLSDEFYIENPSVKSVRWFDRKFNLPVGLTVDNDVDIIDNTFYFQNAVFKAVTGREDKLITQYPIEVDEHSQHLDIAGHPLGSVNAKLLINVVGRREIYFYGDAQKNPAEDEELRHFTFKLNGADFFIPNLTEHKNRIYPVDYNSYLLDLGTFEDETVELDFDTVDEYDFNGGIHVGGLDIDLMRSAFDDLNAGNAVEIVSVDNHELSIKVNALDDEIIFLPIPLNDGWHCSINGVETPIKKIFGGFIGIEVPKGASDIQLKFSMPGVERGLLVSAFGLPLAICLWRKNDFASTLDLPIGCLYMMLAFVLILIMYVVPLIAFILPI